MTNERAIELLHRLQDEQFDGIHGDERREALEMAVRALEQNLVKESGDLVQDLVNDCISRKQAIEAFEPTHYKDWYTPTIIETLETLPSVQLVKEPDGLVKDLVKDCISRQQAIDALDKHIDTFDAIDTNYLCGLRTAMSILKEMPSAQPETHDKRTETHECDLINRQQAIDALNDEYHGMISDESMKIYQIINWISALPSAHPQWIPCSERLPEANGRYLATRGLNACGAMWNRVYIINYSDLMGLKPERIWWDGNVGKSDFERFDDVIAWMPLSKPYGGENE